ncbi:MAG: biotin--[Bacteroidales bacterium]|nr:biotin--[acetyl-CoA-carboxylase] ligase [Bacteroidales bacterium]
MAEMPENKRVGAVVFAHEQTAGKGMGTNCWESHPGENLTFSMGVDMSFMKASNQFLLSQAVPLGLLDVLDEILPSLSLSVKWPNDLFFQDRKLCGILINSTIHGMDMGTSVIGIGLNVNQMQFQEWPTHPISIKMILDEEVGLEPLMKRLVGAVDRRVQLLRTEEGAAKIQRDYLNRLYRYHIWSDYEVNGQKVRRFITGIDGFGRLETLDESKHKCVYDIKEIKFL